MPPSLVSGDTWEILFPIKVSTKIVSGRCPERCEAVYINGSQGKCQFPKPRSFHPYHQEGSEQRISACKPISSGASRTKSTYLLDMVSRKGVKILLLG